MQEGEYKGCISVNDVVKGLHKSEFWEQVN